MSDTAIVTGRDAKNGRFVAGNSGNGGRRPGARSRLGEQFLCDLRDAWNERGAEALRQCAIDDPSAFCKIVAGLLPKTIDINATVDVVGFANNFRQALAMLGNEPVPRPKRPMRVIDHAK